MRKMALKGIRKMEMMEVSIPRIFKSDDVLIRMKVVAVCGSDIHYYTQGRIGSQVVEYPFTVGHECAGIVEEVGKGVTRIKPGDRIAIEPAITCGKCDQCLSGRENTCRNNRFLGCPGQVEGALAEYMIMPERNCFPIPDDMSFDEAAISEPLAIGLYAVKKSIPIENKKVGILGFGPIGYSVLIPTLTFGAESVYITDKIEKRCEKALEAGASYAGNVLNVDVETEILNKEPLGLDVIFECCGQQEAIENAIKLIKPGGSIIMIGIPEFDCWNISADEARRKEISFLNVRRQCETLEETLKGISTGLFKVKKMVSHRFNFEDSDEGFKLLSDYKDGAMKVMIDFN